MICGLGPWDVFDARMRAAVSCAARQHEGPKDLMGDVFACYAHLEQEDYSLQDLESPVSVAVGRALEHHRLLDRFQYDEAHAAMILLSVYESLDAEFGDEG